MRLLKFVGPNEFSLVQVPTHNTLPYAILSHTWIHGQEVTYQDLMSSGGKSKTGYDKIKFCGEQAAKDGFLYFWVDTCCINKLDPTELATAINSMFRWYRNAKKCYVYLADVLIPGYKADIQVDQSTWEAAFQKSKWFTRGWTLQELIAPGMVEFFSQEGMRLGDKQSLEMLIHKTTKIPIKALRGNPFSDFSIAERKEWAAQRQATEEEDMVYCLIGLCEVSMPLLYGEGKDAALKRLGMAIKEFSQDSHELKDQRDNKPPFIVPFERNHRFTGRESQLTQLTENLFQQVRTTKVAIIGLGGVGKTQLLLELVYRVREKYKNCAVIWIPATNKESLQQAYIEVAQKLGITEWKEKKANVKRLVQDYLSNENAGQWLLVFDNADDISMWISQSTSERETGRLIDYLPRSEHGCIVFTTRDRKTAVKLAHENVIKVPEMDENAATQLLRKCLVDPDLVNNQTDTKALLRELTYLPLAIVQAAAYINENRVLFSDYLTLLEEQEDVIDLLNEDFEDDGRYHDMKNPVATTWLISFEQIQHRDRLAADYLSFMACIHFKDIPQSLLPVGPSRKKVINAIGTLDAYSFIIKRSADPAFDIHRLVHLATRNWLQKQGLITQWTERAIMRLEEVFPDHDYQNRSVWRMYLPHIQYALISNIISKDVSNRTKLVWRFGMCLYSDGRYNEAEKQFIEVFTTRKRVLGLEHPSTLTSMANLASTYQKQGRWKEAEELFVLVVETRKKVLGQEHPDTLASMDNLASAYRKQGRWKEAEELFVRVVETSLRVLGQEHPSTLTSMDNLASTYRKQGRWKEAEDLFVLLVETSSRVLGSEHPSTLTSMANLASTYRKQGRWKESEELFVLVMEISSRVLGQEHPDTLANMANLASIYRKQGRWKESEDLFVLVLEKSSRVLGQEHPDTLANMANLASTYRKQGRWKESEELVVLVVETRKRILRPEHPSTLTSMDNLASTYRKQGRWKEAEELFVLVVEMRKKVLGQEHPDTLTSMANLAFTWRCQGKANEALELIQDCVRRQKTILGVDHPHTQSSLRCLDRCLGEE
ncbi:hypothetical protein BGZ60DRAFT_564114 [Tricladium varicosporioides]|nr:hypothetical protein BGZ60DRAFT_564114 [Hymenoscyphus varicosporioides]